VGVHFMYVNKAIVRKRVMARQDHFMRTEIVESQFKSLQFLKVDEKDVLTIDAVIRSRRRWL